MQKQDDGRVPKTLLAVPVLLGLLLAHFTLVGLHVVPPNPVSLKARPAIRAWVLPYFSQRWELFAPEPGGKNTWIHVRCGLADADGEYVTPWIDVTTPLLEQHHANRLGQAHRMLRAFRPRLAHNRDFERRAVKHLDGELAERATAYLDEDARLQFERGRSHMQRLASAECKRRFGSTTIREVEARRVTAPVPAFGRRGDATPPDARALTLPAMPYVEVAL